jgi:hypothetical protein
MATGHCGVILLLHLCAGGDPNSTFIGWRSRTIKRRSFLVYFEDGAAESDA